MKTLDANVLTMITGAASNPAHLRFKSGAPVFDAANNAKARAWNKANHIGANKGGNYTKVDGPFPALYRYLYAIGSRFAPGADD